MERRYHDKQQSSGARRLDNAGTVALWIIHAYCYESWDHTPRLNIRAPEKGCGKTTLVDVISPLVPRSIKTENVSMATPHSDDGKTLILAVPNKWIGLTIRNKFGPVMERVLERDVKFILTSWAGAAARDRQACTTKAAAPEAAQDAVSAG